MGCADLCARAGAAIPERQRIVSATGSKCGRRDDGVALANVPRGPANVSKLLQVLPADGTVPHMPGWKWIHVPGHTPGQVALWREGDRVLFAADAFITTRQESAHAVAIQKPELHGPPAYNTQDWSASRASVERLAALEPELVVTGHGPAMEGPEMRAALQQLARDSIRSPFPRTGNTCASQRELAPTTNTVRLNYGRTIGGTVSSVSPVSIPCCRRLCRML